MKEHHLPVQRTARYFTLGEITDELREIWFVCHGYGQLARYFLRNFESIADKSRLIVAPEALSRFYLQSTNGRIGATWMTREDRENEIADYLAYLNKLSKTIFEKISRQSVRIILLGFSQGVATISRWHHHGQLNADRLILWAGLIPPEIDLQISSEKFRQTDLHLVLGDADPYAQPEIIREHRSRLADGDVKFTAHSFAGGHIIDGKTLQKIAGTPIP